MSMVAMMASYLRDSSAGMMPSQSCLIRGALHLHLFAQGVGDVDVEAFHLAARLGPEKGIGPFHPIRTSFHSLAIRLPEHRAVITAVASISLFMYLP